MIPGVTERGHSVEVFDMTGRTVAVVTVPSSNLREPTPADRPSVRVIHKIILNAGGVASH